MFTTFTERAIFRRLLNYWLNRCACEGSNQPDPDNYRIDEHTVECEYRIEAELQLKKEVIA